jgi:hypothetical protein
VEQTTGFKVVIDTVAGIAEDAQMLSARPEMPVHSIRVNQARLPFADYIVAVQCAFLLRLWSNPSRIPVFNLTDATDDLAAKLVTTAPSLKRLPASSARNTADHFVRGLLHQLCSMPVEIMAINDCFASCPDLHELQAESEKGRKRVGKGSVLGIVYSITCAQLSSAPPSFRPALNRLHLLDHFLCFPCF